MPCRARDRLRVDVRREDPEVRRVERVLEQLREQDRERVRLLPGRAAGGPDAQLVAALLRALAELGQDALLEKREQLWIPHELGHLDEEAVHEPSVLVRVLVEEARVALEVARVDGRDALPQAPLDRRGLVDAEVQPAPLPHPLEDGGDRARVVAAHRLLDDDPLEQAAHAFGLRDAVDQPRRDGRGHGRVAGGRRILDQHGAATLPHHPGARGAVRTRAAEDHRDQALAVRIRGAAEQAIDRRRGARALVRRERDALVRDLGVVAGWHDVDDARLERARRLERPHGERRSAGEHLHEVARMRRIEVLGDDDGQRELGVERAQQPRDGLDPAGGCAHDHELELARFDHYVASLRAWHARPPPALPSGRFHTVGDGSWLIPDVQRPLGRSHPRSARLVGTWLIDSQ